jgi:hypothetical protein
MYIKMKQQFPHTPYPLASGGLFYDLLQRTRLLGPYHWRGAAFFFVLTWLPLLVLSAAAGNALNGSITIPFLLDIASHGRFLLAIPVLVMIEPQVYVLLARTVTYLSRCDIIAEENREAFAREVTRLTKLSASRTVELILLIGVIAIGLNGPIVGLTSGLSSWQNATGGSSHTLTLAGVWFRFVSLPIFQFILFRWLWRYSVWAFFLIKVSRLKLRLLATHSDRAGGLNFIGLGQLAFLGLIMIAGTIIASLQANRFLYEGLTINATKMPTLIFAVIVLLAILGPLIAFAPKMFRAKHIGLLEYGMLAQNYSRRFHEQWVEKKNPKAEELLGTSDIQSLADLANSFAIIQGMKIIPFDRPVIVLTAALLPIALSFLAAVPFEVLVQSVAKILRGVAGF